MSSSQLPPQSGLNKPPAPWVDPRALRCVNLSLDRAKRMTLLRLSLNPVVQQRLQVGTNDAQHLSDIVLGVLSLQWFWLYLQNSVSHSYRLICDRQKVS